MSERLDATVAVVTGASSGIGAATARELARQGASVALLARRRDRLEELAREIGERALVVENDVTDEASVQDAVRQVHERFGRIDTVVANAGQMLLGPIVDALTDEWRRMVSLNVLGLMYTAHATLPHLIAAAQDSPRRVADLVLVSSVAGRVARNGSGVYNATKHAVGAFGEALRQEVTGRHVRVSLVEPGAVATELAGHNRPEIQEGLTKRFASMERMEAEDIAEIVGFIVSRPRRVAVNEVLVRPTEQEQ